MKNTIAERIYDFLKNFPPFDVINKEELIHIASQIKVIYLEENNFLFNQGENPHEEFYIVKDGAIGLYRNDDDKQILIDICDEGDIFGLRALLGKDQYLMSSKTNEESIIYAIPIHLFKKVIETNPKVNQFIIASFATNTRNPYAKNDKGLLFANVQNLENNENHFSEVQTADFSKNPVTCSPETTIKEAALIMSTKRVGSIIIIKNKYPIGIITDKDLRTKVATGKNSINKSVEDIMSSPVVTFHENITVAEAQIAMLKNKITHLCITKDGTINSDLVGILSEHDIVVLHGNNPSVLMKEVKRATSPKDLKYIRDKASNLLKGYIEQNIPIFFVSKIISEINNSITTKAIEFAIKELKEEPPVDFVWLALGSQGRKEQLLLTDQDNALVFKDVENDIKLVSVKNYFLELSEKVTQILHTVGFEYCPAEMMASNPKWCMSISEWKNQFNDWIKKPGDDEIMMCTIFFDFDKIYGNSSLVKELAEYIFKTIDSYEIFLNFLGKNALLNPPPLSFFRQFLVENDGKHKDQFDIKSRAMMPIVDAARLLILSHNEKCINNTVLRFEKLAELEPQNKDLFDSCAQAFKILLRYRTEQGLINNDSGRYINLKTLSKNDKLKLKGCFKPIKDIQELLMVRYNLAQML